MTVLEAGQVEAAELLLGRELGGRRQVRLGEVIDVLSLPGFVASYDDRLVGVVTWQHEPDRSRAELAALAVDASVRGQGVAGLLIEAAVEAARRAGCTIMWLLTTNDNLDALRLYQRHGFRLVEVHPGAVDLARRDKPAIPEVGAYGIPLHDELILERSLP